jgi:hypothetical protein
VEEIGFEEIRVNNTDLVTIKSTDLSDSPLLAIMHNTPVSMVASKDKEKLNGLVPGHIVH